VAYLLLSSEGIQKTGGSSRDSTVLNPVKFFKMTLSSTSEKEVPVFILAWILHQKPYRPSSRDCHPACGGNPPDGTEPLLGLLGYSLGMQGPVASQINGETQRQLVLLFDKVGQLHTDKTCAGLSHKYTKRSNTSSHPTNVAVARK